MPELPDVEIFKQYLDATSLHHKNDSVEIRSPEMLEGVSKQHLTRALTGRKFESTERHGKYLFVHLDDGNWLVLHFGMSGSLKYFKHDEDDPEHDRLLFAFSNGYYLAYVSQRKLGKISFTKDLDKFVEKKELGPDVLESDFDFDAFRETLKGRRGMIKPALMNQQIMAGIGNIYSDEILYQAGIHPRTKVNQLNENDLRAIYQKMCHVLRTAIDVRANPDDFPKSYLTPHRDTDGKCPRDGSDLEKVRVSGRTSYYCPKEQKEL